MKTLREYIDRLKDSGELKDVEEPIHWELEASALTAKFNEEGREALLFQNIKKFEGISLAGGLYAGPGLLYPQKRKPWTKLALGLEFEGEISWEDFVINVLDLMNNPIRPMQLNTGTCKEVIRIGKDADVFGLPVPKLHQNDGGRYGSLSTVIVRDPDTGQSHWGNYRWMAVDGKNLAAHFPTGSPIADIYAKYENKDQNMPFCICIGSSPATTFASQYQALARVGAVDAVGMAGGLAREPLELVKAETNDLLVPADDEIIIEGIVPPGKRIPEGPFPNFASYEPVTQQPVYQVKAITHRKNPIFPFSVNAARGNDVLTLTAILHSVEITRLCRLIGVPVRWAFFPLEARMGMCVLATRVPYKGYLWQVAKYVFSWSNWFDRILFLDYDVSPEEHIQMYNDMTNKASPVKGWDRSDIDAPVHRVCKYLTPEGLTSRMFINATYDPSWPKEWHPMKTVFEENFPQEIQERVLQKWPKLGFKQKPLVLERPKA